MHNIIDPAILFFVFGVLAGLVKSNLEIPPAISRFLSLYLLMALGLKGGFALAKSGLTLEVATGLSLAVTLAVLVPLLSYAVLSRFLSGFDAAAVAATYGSVSAVTFITAIGHLENQGDPGRGDVVEVGEVQAAGGGGSGVVGPGGGRTHGDGVVLGLIRQRDEAGEPAGFVLERPQLAEMIHAVLQ